MSAPVLLHGGEAILESALGEGTTVIVRLPHAGVDAKGERVLKGDLVFPGNDQGKPMSKVTLWRQVKETFARAGIDVNRSGGRTLRNTFAAQKLVRSCSFGKFGWFNCGNLTPREHVPANGYCP